jgi:hypothetical protein
MMLGSAVTTRDTKQPQKHIVLTAEQHATLTKVAYKSETYGQAIQRLAINYISKNKGD